jgi:hypothetical protein
MDRHTEWLRYDTAGAKKNLGYTTRLFEDQTQYAIKSWKKRVRLW